MAEVQLRESTSMTSLSASRGPSGAARCTSRSNSGNPLVTDQWSAWSSLPKCYIAWQQSPTGGLGKFWDHYAAEPMADLIICTGKHRLENMQLR